MVTSKVADVELEDGPDDDGTYPSRPVPSPDDRLWRHPSEIALGATSVNTGRSGRSLVGVTVVASVAASALLVTGLLAATVGLGSSLRDSATRVTLTTAASTSAAVPFAGDRPARGLATVAVVTESGRRMGTGVTVDSEGTLVTAAPLVHDARAITVTLEDGTRHSASIGGIDTESGLAVLSIVSATEPARWASATQLRPGDPVRLQDLLAGTTAIDAEVVGLGREATAGTGEIFDHLMLVDAPAWSISDGAAVMDAEGRVVAIGLLDAEGAVHAVPIDIARGAAESLAADGAVRAALLDVLGDPLPEADAALLGVDGGARINDIDLHGPAAVAGLRAGDVIIEVEGQPVLSFDCLVILIRAHQPGDTLRITYVRNQQRGSVSVVLGERALKGTP